MPYADLFQIEMARAFFRREAQQKLQQAQEQFRLLVADAKRLRMKNNALRNESGALRERLEELLRKLTASPMPTTETGLFRPVRHSAAPVRVTKDAA